MKNENIKKEFQELNKDIYRENKNLQLQNQKIHELNDKLKDVDEKSKITQKYTSGFNSIFGFIPKIFSWNSNKNKNSKNSDKNKDSKSNEEMQQHSNLVSLKNNNYDINKKCNEQDLDEDELEKEIRFLNENAKNIKNSIDKSIKGTHELNQQIDKTTTKIENNKKNAEKYLK
jgi:hypothetical protein